jgi:hypothetical protein
MGCWTAKLPWRDLASGLGLRVMPSGVGVNVPGATAREGGDRTWKKAEAAANPSPTASVMTLLARSNAF